MIELFHDTSRDCSRITTQRYSSSFSRAIGVLHPALRGPVYDLYGFVRFADEIVDTMHDFDKQALLTRFIDDTFHALDTGISLNPILNSFQLTVNKYAIDRALIEDFFSSMQMDIAEKKYDITGYEKYIYGSAETVGLMCLHVFCAGDKEKYLTLKPAAQALGAAFQKINFLRDLKADHEHLQRTYFPGVNFRNFSEKDKREIEADISADLVSACAGIMQLPRSSRFGVYLAYKYYLSLFKKIRRAEPALLLKKRVRISNTFKAFIFLRAGLRNSFNLL